LPVACGRGKGTGRNKPNSLKKKNNSKCKGRTLEEKKPVEKQVSEERAASNYRNKNIGAAGNRLSKKLRQGEWEYPERKTPEVKMDEREKELYPPNQRWGP